MDKKKLDATILHVKVIAAEISLTYTERALWSLLKGGKKYSFKLASSQIWNVKCYRS